MPHFRWPSHGLLSLAILVLPAAITAQGTSPAGLQASSYLDRYRELTELSPRPDQVADVHHLVLTRDVGVLTLEQGKLYLMAPVGGRTVAAVFEGTGRFTFTPTLPTEQGELNRILKTPALDDTLSEAVLLFADSTMSQLKGLTFAAGDVPGAVKDHARDLVNSLKGKNEGSFDPGVIGPLLNGESNGLFVARLDLANAGKILFEDDPSGVESTQLYQPAHRTEFGAHWDLVSQSPPTQAPVETNDSWSYRDRLDVSAYKIDVALNETFTADLDFAATATVSMRAIEPVGPWLLFDLQWKIQVDSARWGDGTRAETFKAKDSPLVWVRAPRRLAPGDSLSLTVTYHATHPDLIDRLNEWFFLEPGTPWYPVNGQGRDLATFDLTFHSPKTYPLASVGEKVDSSIAGKVVTTHWILQRPTDFAIFNLGVFDNYHVQQTGAPPLNVMISEEAHRELVTNARHEGFYIPEQSHMRENVASDVSNSLKYYSYLFGDSPYKSFYVTEIPYGEGVSFPGFIDLSWSTFQTTTIDGFDEFFRAHEVAHQWWGNGVNQASYRDKWLTEGLASFSALWYLQAERKHNDEYFKFLDKYKDDITGEYKDVGPIWVGYRASTFSVPQGYQTMIYNKGAWVFHMIRMMMLDFNTMKEDRFTETMKDYYQTFQGKSATTADFQGVVERHAGIPMDWFFDEWVKGTGIPTYHVAWTSQPADNNRFTVKLRVTQDNVSPDFKMLVPVTADLGDGRVARFRFMIKAGQIDYTSPLLPAAAKNIKFNDLHAVLADVKMERW